MSSVSFAHGPAIVLAATVLAACGGSRPTPQNPAPAAPEQTVAQFLAAANAADLERMASLWGDRRGPSNLTNTIPPDQRQTRLTIMQRLLASDEHRVLRESNEPTGARLLQVELVRGTRRFTVPFTLVPARTGGWLINAIGLDAAMPPTRP